MASTVDCREVDHDIARFVNEVAEDGVDSCRGIGDENAGFNRSIYEFCDSCTGFVKAAWVFVTDEPVWSTLALVLEIAKGGSDFFGECAEGACVSSSVFSVDNETLRLCCSRIKAMEIVQDKMISPQPCRFASHNEQR